MKILIINALITGGGTEVQTQRERCVLSEHGHDVYLLTFDANADECTHGNNLNCHYKRSTLFRVYYRNHVDKAFSNRVKTIIDEVSPNIIHINNLQDNAFSVLEACKGYKVVKTIRDPSIVCPKTTCLLRDRTLCKGYCYGACHSCIGKNLNYQIVSFQAKKIRAKYVDVVSRFVCPSQYLTNVCNENGIPTECLNNPFDFSIIRKEKETHNKTFLYYGFVSVDKGVRNLLKAFKNFHNSNEDAKLIIAGRLGDISICELHEYADDGVEYVGVLSQQDVMELYKSVFCVVVPSIWLENYPNTVLEALACKTLVIGANRGGISELVGNAGFLFNPLLVEDIEKCLELAYNVNEDEYNAIVNKNYDRVRDNNTLCLYYKRFIELINSID